MNEAAATHAEIALCITCRLATGEGEFTLPGVEMQRELEGLLAAPENAGIRLRPVECLSVCKRPCTVAVSGPGGKWTYIVGGLDVAQDAPALLDYARAHAASAHGTPPLKERPAAIRAGTIARIPPAS